VGVGHSAVMLAGVSRRLTPTILALCCYRTDSFTLSIHCSSSCPSERPVASVFVIIFLSRTLACRPHRCFLSPAFYRRSLRYSTAYTLFLIVSPPIALLSVIQLHRLIHPNCHLSTVAILYIVVAIHESHAFVACQVIV
jgi:hypothetical protein